MKTIATLGPIGYLPKIPGTAGSLVGLGILFLLKENPLWQAIGCLVAIGLALWSAGPIAKKMGSADPHQIVIDEMAGIMVALATLPATWKVYLSGLLLFRFFDIVKPPPIRQLQRLPGSFGIVLDDLLAGLATQLSLRVVLLFLVMQ